MRTALCRPASPARSISVPYMAYHAHALSENRIPQTRHMLYPSTNDRIPQMYSISEPSITSHAHSEIGHARPQVSYAGVVSVWGGSIRYCSTGHVVAGAEGDSAQHLGSVKLRGVFRKAESLLPRYPPIVSLGTLP
eukprot:58563-Rhodomonas_salina.1